MLKLFANEFRPVIEPDRLWAADISANPFEHSNDIGAAELLHFDRWRQPSGGRRERFHRGNSCIRRSA
jgi:hypothetical protein